MRVMMPISRKTVMAIKSYQTQAEGLVRTYLLADPVISYTAVFSGILACKMGYDITQVISSAYSKTYATLTKIQKIEWNN
ncbi:hypothetical protein MKW92_019666, partial [Papaver armeniacum]